MYTLIAIGLGGSAGALTRFWLGNALYALLGRSFPIGTLVINVSGSFLMGFLSELMLVRFPVPVEYRAAILVGFLGAYTTFSTFALESYALMEEGSFLKSALNMMLSVALCVGAVWVGIILGRRLFGDTQLLGEGQGWVLLKLAGIFISVSALALVTELAWRNLQYPVVWRDGAMLGLLSVGAIGATAMTAIGGAPAMLPVWFFVNAAMGALAVGAGMWLGRL